MIPTPATNTTPTPDKPKLSIELIPKTSWYENVRSNVSPERWTQLKRSTAARAKHRCEICAGKGPRWPVECHEIWNFNTETKTQTLTGLIALCPRCHEVAHFGLAMLKGRQDHALTHLKRINGWSLEQAVTHVNDSFKLWETRNLVQWKLNITWLETTSILRPQP